MDLKKLNKSELQKLKSEIDVQIKAIDDEATKRSKKESELSLIERSKNIACLKDMRQNDAIFCISYYSGRNIGVDRIGYCYLKSLNKDEKYGGYRISVGHDTEPLGSSSGISDDEANKHYYLSKMCESYHFYTLRPEQWKEDLQEALDYLIKERRKYFNRDNKVIRDDIKSIMSEEAKINGRISEIA